MPILPLLLIAAAAPAQAVPSPAVSTLSPDSEARWVSFDLTPGNQIRFAMTLDGRAVTAILDTGVSYSVLSDRYAAANGMKVRAEGHANVVGGTVDIGQVDTATLAMGGLSRRGGTLTVATLPAAATGSASAVDLLVGRDLTADYALDIDYAARRFRLLPSGRLPFAGASGPLAISPTRQVYVSAIAIDGARLLPVIVDTGDGAAVTVSAGGWARTRLPPPVTTTVSFGLAGPVVNELSIVRALSVGNLVARHVEVRVEPAGGFSDTVGAAGRIGSGFLQHYRVLLDPRAGHIVFAPGPEANRPPLRSTSGLLLGLTEDRLRVLHVMRGSPAAAAGWRDGDTICAIDGHKVTPDYATAPMARWSTGRPGRVVALTPCGGAPRPLTLRHFY